MPGESALPLVSDSDRVATGAEFAMVHVSGIVTVPGKQVTTSSQLGDEVELGVICAVVDTPEGQSGRIKITS